MLEAKPRIGGKVQIGLRVNGGPDYIRSFAGPVRNAIIVKKFKKNLKFS
jgi:hypothetical protein